MAFLTDGYQTFLTFGDNASVKLEEVGVTAPAVQGGGAIDTTTMRNSTWRTQDPKTLKGMGNLTTTVAYDPEIYDEVITMLNSNQKITVTFSDGSSLEFYGWIDDFSPGEATEGGRPTADITVIPSLKDDSGTETAPVYYSATSTSTSA